MRYKLPKSLRPVLSAAGILILALAVLVNFANLPFSRSDLLTMYHNPALSYDEKMRIKIGPELYDYIRFLQDNLPLDAVVLIPPQAHPWGSSGHPEFMNYFLHPRTLLKSTLEQKEVPPEVTHVLVAKGEGPLIGIKEYGWPRFPIYSSLIVYQDGGKLVNTVFLPDDPKNKMAWGFLEVAR